VLGRLFSSRRWQNKESELLVTLSPQVVQAVSREELPEPALGGQEKNQGGK
jgi:Flp pilus assembly secretin CpaC